MDKSIVSVEKQVLQNELKFNGETLLTYKIEYPEFKSSFYQMSIEKVNDFYKTKALDYQKYCETKLFDSAKDQYKFDLKNGFPVRAFEALAVYKTTYLMSCIISIYFDKYEFDGGAHGTTIRESQTWNLQSYTMINLKQIFKCSLDFKTYILKSVEDQVKKNPSDYFQEYEKLIKETFNENSFYCNPDSITVYYQQYDIAPYVGGIIEFKIPYTKCIINPTQLCFTIK